MKEHDISSYSEGLTKIVDHIETLVPQCPLHYRDERDKLRFLRRAVLTHNWAQHSVQNIVTSRYTFNQFVTSLRESLEVRDEIGEEIGPNTGIVTEEDTPLGSYYGKYGRNPKHVRKFPPRKTHTPYQPCGSYHHKPRSFAEARRRSECFQCGKHWQPRHRCSPGSIIHNNRTRIQREEHPINIISDISMALEAQSQEDPTSGNTSDQADADHHETNVTGTEDIVTKFDSLT